MEVVKEEKYVGDIITGDGKHTKNIMARRSKGIGIVSEIISILDGLFLGKHYFRTAVMLRQAMLLSVLLFNSETWLRLNKADLNRLEGVDRMFLRRVFQVPTSTPTAALYLETGCLPINVLMKVKRIMFLHHILTRQDDALIKKVFCAQASQPVKGDWVLVVKEDMEYIGLGHLTFENIAGLSKGTLRTMVKAKARDTAWRELMAQKEKSSKLAPLKYASFSMQPYLTAECNLSNRAKRALFRWRSHTISVQQNWGMKNAKCPLCESADDTQYHLLTCPKLKTPQPWNIESVVEALRQREVILEEKEKNQDHTQTEKQTPNTT